MVGKRKERKLKKQMEDKARQVPLPDLLDDLNREQIEPAPEPLVDQQDERWAYQAGDPRQPIPTPGPENDKKNGQE